MDRISLPRISTWVPAWSCLSISDFSSFSSRSDAASGMSEPSSVRCGGTGAFKIAYQSCRGTSSSMTWIFLPSRTAAWMYFWRSPLAQTRMRRPLWQMLSSCLRGVPGCSADTPNCTRFLCSCWASSGHRTPRTRTSSLGRLRRRFRRQ